MCGHLWNYWSGFPCTLRPCWSLYLQTVYCPCMALILKFQFGKLYLLRFHHAVLAVIRKDLFLLMWGLEKTAKFILFSRGFSYSYWLWSSQETKPKPVFAHLWHSPSHSMLIHQDFYAVSNISHSAWRSWLRNLLSSNFSLSWQWNVECAVVQAHPDFKCCHKLEVFCVPLPDSKTGWGVFKGPLKRAYCELCQPQSQQVLLYIYC